jgi:hypothetical protein
METLTGLIGNDAIQAGLPQLSVAQRRVYFQSAVLKMYNNLYPTKTADDFDRFRFGDLTYLRVYDLLDKKS